MVAENQLHNVILSRYYLNSVIPDIVSSSKYLAADIQLFGVDVSNQVLCNILAEQVKLFCNPPKG